MFFCSREMFRIYYLNNGKSKGAATDDEAERIVNILHDRDMTYEQLRAANADAHNRVSELQAELALLKSKQEANETTYDHLLHKNQRLGSLQLEENLKRERQAAQAIAQHDAALIAKYEKEIERLQDIHTADASLISECADRVAELMKIVEEKNKQLESKSQALEASQRQTDVLTDRLSKQEVLLIKNEASHKSNAISSLARAILPPPVPPMEQIHSQGHRGPGPGYNDQHHRLYSNGGNTFFGGASTPMAGGFGSGQFQDRSRYFTPGSGPASEAVGLTDSLKPAPKLGAPFMGGMSNSGGGGYGQHISPTHSHILDSSGMPIRRERPEDRGRGQSIGSNRDDWQSTFNTQSTFNGTVRSVQFTSSTTMPGSSQKLNMSSLDGHDGNDIDNKPKSVLYRELQQCKVEIETLKAENATLRDSIAADRALIKTQEKTLEHVRASAEEITLLEAEEIARLEAELERVSDERDRWQANARKYEAKAYESKGNTYSSSGGGNGHRGTPTGNNPSGSGGHRGDSPIPRSRSPAKREYGQSSGYGQYGHGSTPNRGRSSSPRRGNGGVLGGSSVRGRSPVGKDMYQSESAVIEMYR
jgi:hypothetical protein